MDPLLASYPIARPSAGKRLFCFPFAGAGASIFRDWPENLPEDIEVVGIQLPGRESRIAELPFRDLRAAAESIASVLHGCSDLPLALFGHSVGALLAFEVARALRASYSSNPVHLFVSGCGAPGRSEKAMPIHRLPDDALIRELRRYGGTPEETLQNRELMQWVLPAIRADFELSETYQYERQAPLECPITVFAGLQDAIVRNSDLPAWRAETVASFNIRMFPGDHYFLRSCRLPLLRAIGQLGFAHDNNGVRGLDGVVRQQNQG